MARPTARLEISYAPPGSVPEWIDESDYLIRFNVDRGRSNELDRQNAGTATLVLINRDGRFDPVNASGAHYPNVLPMRRVRLTTEISTAVAPFTLRSSTLRGTTQTVLRGGTQTFALYTGFVETWSQTWALGNGDAAVTVRCVDAFKIFNLVDFVWGVRYSSFGGLDTIECGLTAVGVVPDIGTGVPGAPQIPDDLAGDRITRLLDCLDWPEADRDIDPGTVTIWGADPVTDANIRVQTNALTHLLQVADTEGGYVFIDGTGRVRFIDADNVPALETTDVFGGATGEIHFFDISAPFDDARLWNAITVTNPRLDLVPEATAEDATSITEFYRREYTTTLLTTATAVLEARADELLARYKDPHLRIEQLELAPADDDEWRHILGYELADVVLVRKRPAIADQIGRELRIEGVTIEAPGGTDWQVTWRLSDVGAHSAGVFGAAGTEFGGGTFGELLGAASAGAGFDSGTFDSSTFAA